MATAANDERQGAETNLAHVTDGPSQLGGMPVAIHQVHGPNVLAKLLLWMIFGVFFALMPVAFNAVSILTHGGKISYDRLAGRGELLLIAAAIAAMAAGELIISPYTRMKSVKLVLVGLNMLTVCMASLWFGDVSAAIQNNTAIDQAVVSGGSTLVLVFALLSSGSSIIVAGLR